MRKVEGLLQQAAHEAPPPDLPGAGPALTLVPPGPGEVVVETPDGGSIRIEADDMGFFDFLFGPRDRTITDPEQLRRALFELRRRGNSR